MDNKDIRIIYSYFSHHIRTCTAMISASLTLLSYHMTEEEESLINGVMDASFLLDLFDCGMSISMGHLLEEENKHGLEIVELDKSVQHFLKQCSEIINEKDLDVDVDIPQKVSFSGNGYAIRNLVNILIYETILQSKGTMRVSLKGKILQIYCPDSFDAVPEVWQVLQKVLAPLSVSFMFDESQIYLEFKL